MVDTQDIVPIKQEPITLIHFETARKELELARTIDEVKNIRDQAEAIRLYAKQQNDTFEIQNNAAEIKLRAERKLGVMFKEIPRSEGGDSSLFSRSYQDGMSVPLTYTEILKQNNIPTNTAYRWQLEAEVPEDKFEQFIEETLAKKEELTSAAIIKTARKIKQEAHKEELKTQPLPLNTFNVIYADPPWKYNNNIESWGPATLHYPTLELEKIIDLKDNKGTLVTDIIADNAVLFLWVTNPFLRDAFEIVDGWGFEYKTNIVWIKRELQRPGSGFYVRGRHELLFICTKGNFVPDQKGKEPIGSVIEAPVGNHSAKPIEGYEIIQKMYPEGKYVELFARGEPYNDKWTIWGNEIIGTS